MTGIEIFFCGGFMVIAIFCLLFLTGIIKPVSQKPSEETVDKLPTKEETASDKTHVVAPSKFNVDEFMAQISSEVISDVRKELPKILKEAIGEVKISDIKFEEGYEDDSDPDDDFVPRKFKALNTDETDDAFNTDLRNIDDTPPSEPIATGTSIDELEKAMDVAMDNKSSDEELAEAGKVIQPFTVTKLFDAITTNEEIDRRIELCLTLALRAELSMKLKPAKGDSHNDKKKEPSTASAQQTTQVKVEPERSEKQSGYDFNKLNSDDFDLDEFVG
ncbi:hypothetical protein E4T81_03740 [Barnesiella sp. WM24]|uniref:hypothetical protein n=1 Tax=Barnesiella sp. WM24 TaxID=2558278 RepID=UPI0010728A68|nr:hypothetical protein [Barnesiella sp. WM24]TFU94365.1 hypothetical protein E4T81_03740 [Barnesiella sp. WM24]